MLHRILALDLSLTATGTAGPDGRLGTFKPKTKGDRRLEEFARRLTGTLEQTTPTLVVIEDLPTGLRNAAAGSLGLLHGAARLTLMQWGLNYLLIPPATLKVFATGRGNAQKPDLRMELYKRTAQDVPDDNQVDAAWLRLLGLHLMGEPQLQLPQTHLRALDKLERPTIKATT